jgi:hypothetical protein
VNRDLVEQGALINKIEAVGGTVHLASASRALVEATLDAAQLSNVATYPEVLAIDPWSVPETDMNNAREDGGANLIEAARGYRGQGVRGEVMDGGSAAPIRVHCPAAGLPHRQHDRHEPWHVDVRPDLRVGRGRHRPRHAAPGQGIFAAYTNVPDRWAHTAQLVDPANTYHAVFQSNSWGDALTTSYTTISAAMDDIVFDHDILICQSQSNAGTRSSRPQAWAKNVVSVGGQYHFNTLSRTDDK